MTMVARLLDNPVAQRFARVHLHFLWQGLIVAIVAWLLLVTMRRASASARHWSLVILLGVLAGCPLATFILIAGGPSRRGGERLRGPVKCHRERAGRADDCRPHDDRDKGDRHDTGERRPSRAGACGSRAAGRERHERPNLLE